jgi:hypothetical protein
MPGRCIAIAGRRAATALRRTMSSNKTAQLQVQVQ